VGRDCSHPRDHQIGKSFLRIARPTMVEPATNQTYQNRRFSSGLKRKTRRRGVPRRDLRTLNPNDSNVKE
jgi:hypothetical protein